MEKRLLIIALLFFTFYNLKAQNTDTTQTTEKLPNWENIFSIGASISHTLNVNAPTTTPKQSMNFTNALDLSSSYIKENTKIRFDNSLNWTFTFAKGDPKSRTINSLDQILTFHDMGYSIKKKGDWFVNLIINTENHAFKQYEGNFLKDYYQLGPIQSFLNPFVVTISPGLQYTPKKWLKISLSPYSISYTGLTNQFIADKGAFIEDRKTDGHYETKKTEQLGAALNIWAKKRLNKRIDFDYKYNISSSYFEQILNNGKMNGTFITNFLIIKGLKLSHRANLKGDFTVRPFKPFYNQVVILAYTLKL